MNVHDEMSDNEVLRAASESLSRIPMASPPDVEAIMARGRAHRRRRFSGVAGMSVAAAGTALALGLTGVLGPAPARAPGTIRTALFTLVSNSNGTATLTINPKELVDAAALQNDLRQYGIPALVTSGSFCSSDPRRPPFRGCCRSIPITGRGGTLYREECIPPSPSTRRPCQRAPNSASASSSSAPASSRPTSCSSTPAPTPAPTLRSRPPRTARCSKSSWPGRSQPRAATARWLPRGAPAVTRGTREPAAASPDARSPRSGPVVRPDQNRDREPQGIEARRSASATDNADQPIWAASVLVGIGPAAAQSGGSFARVLPGSRPHCVTLPICELTPRRE